MTPSVHQHQHQHQGTQGTAWFVLSWTLSKRLARAALEKAGVKVKAKRFHKTGTSYLTFRHRAMNGTVYFNDKDRMASVLLQRTGPWAPDVVKGARQRLVQRFGKVGATHTVVRRHWRNPHTTLTVTSVPTASVRRLTLTCVSDRDAKRSTPRGGFAAVKGFSSLVWGLKPQAAKGAAQKLGYSARIITKRLGRSAANARAPRPSGSTYRIVGLSGPRGTGTLSFDDQDGLTQIVIHRTFPSRTALVQRVATLSARYGPPHTLERTRKSTWSSAQTRASLIVTTRKPHPILSLSEEYRPIRRR